MEPSRSLDPWVLCLFARSPHISLPLSLSWQESLGDSLLCQQVYLQKWTHWPWVWECVGVTTEGSRCFQKLSPAGSVPSGYLPLSWSHMDERNVRALESGVIPPVGHDMIWPIVGPPTQSPPQPSVQAMPKSSTQSEESHAGRESSSSRLAQDPSLPAPAEDADLWPWKNSTFWLNLAITIMVVAVAAVSWAVILLIWHIRASLPSSSN